MNRYMVLQKVVELGSFTKAADVLGYTQPAISQMISSLEKELSIKLLYRSRYGVRLTLEGERLFPAVEKATAGGTRAGAEESKAEVQPGGEVTAKQEGILRGALLIFTCQQVLSLL